MDVSLYLARQPVWFVLAVTVVLAASIGSFLNVVIWRLPRGESLVRPASRCPGCEQPIAWYDNVPILSWLILRGRCRRCGTGIDARYVMVEVVTTALALACWAVFGPTFAALRAFSLCALLVPLTYIDLEHWLLPHALTWPGIVLGLATAGLGGGPGWLAGAIGAGAGFLALWLVRVLGTLAFKKEAMGFGDLFLMAMLGAYLGWRSLAPLVFLASLQASVVGIALILRARWAGEEEEDVEEEAPPATAEPPEPQDPGEPEIEASSETSAEAEEDRGAGGEAEEEDDWVPPPGALPFGPFLALAGLEMLFFGPEILGWILGYIGI